MVFQAIDSGNIGLETNLLPDRLLKFNPYISFTALTFYPPPADGVSRFTCLLRVNR